MGAQSVWGKSRTHQIRPGVSVSGGPVIQRDTVNFIPGSGTITAADNPANHTVDVTITAPPLDPDLIAIAAIPSTGAGALAMDATGGWIKKTWAQVATALGLGTAAFVNTGTSGATIPLLNANNTWSANQGFVGTSISLSLKTTSFPANQWTVTANDTTGELVFKQGITNTLTFPLAGGATFAGSVSGSNLSGTNTGDNAGVTSVAAGAGMNFTTITATGSVVMGTPSTLTATTTNSASGTTHTHAITTGTSGANIPLLNGVNTWSGAQTWNANSGVNVAAASASFTVTSGHAPGAANYQLQNDSGDIALLQFGGSTNTFWGAAATLVLGMAQAHPIVFITNSLVRFTVQAAGWCTAALGVGVESEYSNGTFGASGTIGWAANGQFQSVTTTTLTACAISYTAPPKPCWLTLKIIAPTIGTASAVTLPGKGSTAITQTLAKSDIIRCYYDGTTFWNQVAVANA